ncbi:NACHT domain-containing protein [Streptomyces sp. CA-251387]|uniref:NACHT domain-containing protein n=1 Tax=Streptomyces sp. CA-251387 TaxID=3240064 RepID=UPI003D8FB5FD
MVGDRTLGRVVAVLTERQGTGVLLDSRFVLTAAHVVENHDLVEVVHPSGLTVECQVEWVDEHFDMALLYARRTVILPGSGAPLGRVRTGKVVIEQPLPHCQIVGFPQNQRYGQRGEDLEYDQYRATVLPMAGRMRDLLVCELDLPAADGRNRRTSPLAGLSGAPVFAGKVLLGIVTQVPQDRHHLRIEAAPVASALNVSRGAEFLSPWFEDVTDVHPQDELFESHYAADLSSQYRKTEIFGIDELGRSESRWDLDTAYLSLQAAESLARRRGVSDTAPQRIDTLLSDRPRVLLRGEAGAGKTTLVWWLAAHAASGTLGPNLDDLNGLVPFVVPMREMYARGGRFPTVSELPSAGPGITDGAPDGWARRVLEARRALLLVDGLDEVPDREREEARRWLSALLDRYPHTRCLATVRPNAVDKDWLAQDGFAELTLLPMSDEDITAFVGAWHDAARVECEHFYDIRRGNNERDLLTGLEQALVHQLGQNAPLRDMARTPLLCAVICALHRRRRGLLPTTRWSLYRAALAMLLGGRDAGRGVHPTDHVTLDSDEQHALLQRLAVWLVRTGQQQMTRDQAIHQLQLAIRDMRQIREQGTPERVLLFLLHRSGLLRERGDDAIEFIHRTFQDFLAAKEFHESGYVLELLKHAEEKTWSDVIVLAVGHATRKDTHDLIEALVLRGDDAPTRAKRWHFHLLAARCATSLLALDETLMDRVRDRGRALMPPQTVGEVSEVAELGDWAVDMLPGPDGLSAETAGKLVTVLVRIRSARSRQALKRFATHPSDSVRHGVVIGWALQPTEEYARDVLAGMHCPSLRVSRPLELACLTRFGTIQQLVVSGPHSAEELDARVPVRDIERIEIRDNSRVDNLEFLRKRKDVRDLVLDACPQVRDLHVLSDLALISLSLSVRGFSQEQLRFLHELRGLRRLSLTGDPRDGWAAIRPHTGVRELRVTSERDEWLLDLDRWASLRRLDANIGGRDVPEIVHGVSRAPEIEELALVIRSFQELVSAVPLPQIRRLRLLGLIEYSHVSQVRRTFPGVSELALSFDPPSGVPQPLDLRSLLELPGLAVTLMGAVPEEPLILGAEEFGTRLTIEAATR